MATRTILATGTRVLGLTALLCVVFLGAGRAVGQVPAKPAELNVLDRLVGKWDSETFAKVAEWTPMDAKTKGVLVREWVLDGRFVQEKGEHSDNVRALVMFGYDEQKKAYRIWHFSSMGYRSDSTAQWDETTQTLTGRSEGANGITTTATIRFIDQDTHEWRATTKDAAGKVYFDGGGKCTRKK